MKRLLLASLMCSLLMSGCVKKSIYIASEPAGAAVYYDYEYKGETPLTFDFEWFWYHRFELIREGYEPLTVEEKISAPFYLWIPLDLFCELMPFPIHHTKRLNYKLEATKNEDIF